MTPYSLGNTIDWKRCIVEKAPDPHRDSLLARDTIDWKLNSNGAPIRDRPFDLPTR